eukprot:10298493-Lingulodinium_polyedra.AAC.1
MSRTQSGTVFHLLIEAMPIATQHCAPQSHDRHKRGAHELLQPKTEEDLAPPRCTIGCGVARNGALGRGGRWLRHTRPSAPL